MTRVACKASFTYNGSMKRFLKQQALAAGRKHLEDLWD
jgi:hypothetical protein